jgi:T5SS/PEP-CTERM-associated repeat protein
MCWEGKGLHRRGSRTRAAVCIAAGSVFPLHAHAVGKIWIGNGTSNWNTNNWFQLPIGPSGTGPPVSGDDAYLTQDDGNDRIVNFDSGFSPPSGLLSLTVDATGTGTMTFAQPNNNRFRANTQYIGDGGHGIYLQSNGTNDAGTLYLGYGAGSSGTYGMSNAASALNISAALYVGYGGSGTMNQTGGNVTVTNGAEMVLGYFSGSSGVYNLSGGTLSTPGLRIGDDDSATGQFVQSGGTASVSADLEIASFSNSSVGSYSISNGRLIVGRNMLLGEAGTGTFMQSGGTVQLTGGGTNGLIIGSSPVSGTNPASIGSYTLSAGLLSVTGRVYVGFAGNGSFTQSGGTNAINGRLVLASATGTNTSAADYSLQGGTLNVTGDGVIQLNAGGTFTQSGGTLTYTTFNMDGGTVNGTLTNGGTFNYSAGTFNGRLVNSAAAAMNLSADFVAGNGMANAANLSFASNRTVTLNGAGLNNTGTIQLLGAQITGSGPLVNNGTLSGNGTISGTGGFTNNATWTLSLGNYSLSNTGLNANFGTLTIPAATSGVSLSLDDAAARLDNSGTINLNTNASIGGVGGLVNKPAGTINAGNATIATAGFTNQGNLNVGIGGSGDLTVNPAFSNSGTVTLTGLSNNLSGGAIANTGVITGAGQVNNVITNSGAIFPVLGGSLVLAGAVVNQAGGVMSVGPGATLTVNALSANAGTINVSAGGTFSDGTFANSGQINVSGTLDIDSITNTGTITYSGGAGSIDSFGPIVNNAGGTIVLGAGSPNVIFYDNLTHAAGASFTVSAGATANFLGNVSGGGNVTNHGTLNLSAGKTYALGKLSGSGSTILFESTQLSATQIVQNSLTLNSSGATGGASVSITPAGTAGTLTNKLNTLTIAGGPVPIAPLDLANTNLMLDYSLLSPIVTVRSQLRSGFNPAGTRWMGNGIASSSAAADSTAALGYGEASTILGISGTQTASWFGQTADATSLLIRYTKAGDTNLDGTVNFLDLVAVAQHYGDVTGLRVWTEGDLNYDGNVDFNDLVMLAQNYGASLPSAPLPAQVSEDFARAMASVPEPGSMWVLGVAGVLLGRRRGCRASNVKRKETCLPH